MDKKGQVGLRIVIGVFSALLVLVVLTLALFVITSVFRPVIIAQDRDSTSVVNETLTTVNNVTAETVAFATDPNFIMTTSPVPVCINSSNGFLLNTTNYTVTASGTVLAVSANCFGINGGTGNAVDACGYDWDCSYTFSSTPTDAATDISGNSTNALNTFFSNISTVLAVLIAVVIILAVAMIIAVTRRFGTGGSGSTASV